MVEQFLIDQFLVDAKEIDVDAISDGKDVFILWSFGTY